MAGGGATCPWWSSAARDASSSGILALLRPDGAVKATSQTMKRLCILALLIATVLAGCGGSSNSSHTSSTATSPTAAGTSPAAGSSLSDCTTVGIDPSGMREGTCTHDGITWVIVNENHTLKLSTLWARLAGVSASKTLTSGNARRAANGEFVIASLTLTNKLPAPQTFDQANTQQAGLILKGAVFKEAVGAERGEDASSCLRRAAAPLRTGKRVTCDVIFEVPAIVAADLGKHGSGDLYLVNFGSDLSASAFPQTVGQIRLYR